MGRCLPASGTMLSRCDDLLGLFLRERWLRLVSLAALFLVAGCNSETLFQSDFDPTAKGQPPAVMQAVGTAATFGPPGSVVVIDPVIPMSDKWVQISRPTGGDVVGLQGKLSASPGDSVYTFAATMFMTPDSGVATIQFETASNPVSSLDSFLHVDLMENNQIRIDDNEATRFGSFPRNQPFIIQVTLDINASSSTAHIALGGAGASGTADHTILPPFQAMSRQFGAIRVWQGFPHTGAFDATNIVVTRRLD
jgi:hypothetical protein